MTRETYVDLINYLDNRINFNEMSTDARIYYNDIAYTLEDNYGFDNSDCDSINDVVREFLDDVELI